MENMEESLAKVEYEGLGCISERYKAIESGLQLLHL